MSKPMHFIMGLLAAVAGFVAARLVWTLFDWVSAHGTGRVDEALAELERERWESRHG